MSSGGKTSARAQVLQLMKDLNRPCSVNCLIDKNTDPELGKSMITKALEKLVEVEMVTLKEFGKNKIYTLKQKPVGDPELAKIELRTLDMDITSAQQKLKEKSTELKNLEAQLQKSTLKKSASSLRRERSEVENMLADIKIKIKHKNDQNALQQELSPAEKKSIKQQYEKYLTAYKKRKRLCNDMIDAIMEGYPGTKKKLLEDIGLETDEDAGFVFESLLK